MPKRAKLLDRPNAWAWVCDVAATEGLDLTGMSLFEAAQCAVSHLEHRRDAGLPLNPEAVKLASLLARLEGESAVSGASTGDLFLERAYARERARLLADRYAAGLRVWSRRPEIPEPEPARSTKGRGSASNSRTISLILLSQAG